MKKLINKAENILRGGGKAAEKGMLSAKDIQVKREKADYPGKRSIGTVDPGVRSSYLILKTIYNQI
ncbi:MAG: DAK2 domain-containing protein [Fusobacteriales bacterium]|jgi:dihydroxyacetone kinase|nr:DAK2 domain-containing protein [Fusobacteriales bacterium]